MALTVKIGGKDYDINPTYGAFEDIFKKYDLSKADQMSAEESRQFSINILWACLKRGRFGIKPFGFKRRVKNNITMAELAKISGEIPKWITGEDREAGD